MARTWNKLTFSLTWWFPLVGFSMKWLDVLTITQIEYGWLWNWDVVAASSGKREGYKCMHLKARASNRPGEVLTT